MAIVINGSGTVTGLSIGGLPDVSMDIANLVDGLIIQPNSDGSAPSTGTLNGATGILGIGKDVFAALTSGDNNIAIGDDTLKANTTGYSNVAVGESALKTNIDGRDNTMVGKDAGQVITSGAMNAGVGAAVFNACTTGNYNTAVGRKALHILTEGHGNVAIGQQAGDLLTTGDYNIVIGHNADAASATDDNQLSIGGWIKGVAGQITMPNQPSFSVNMSAVQSNIAASTEVTIQFDTEIFDTNADFNTGTYTFTAPVTGKYLLTLATRLQAVQNDSTYIVVKIKTSNREYSNIEDVTTFVGDADYWTPSVAAVADMDANDTAYAVIYASATGDEIDVGNSAAYTKFSGILLA